jgi:carbon monoxide dehydrogenase subunit G
VKLSARYRLPAPREKVFGALMDPDVLQRSIEGCERLAKTSADTYEAFLKIGIGSLKGSYTGTIRLTDISEPGSFTLHVDGKGTPGFVKASARMELVEQDGATEVRCDAEGRVGGLIATVGSRLVEAAGKKLMDRFWDRLAAELAGR